jgi:hypothetical protein
MHVAWRRALRDGLLDDATEEILRCQLKMRRNEMMPLFEHGRPETTAAVYTAHSPSDVLAETHKHADIAEKKPR